MKSYVVKLYDTIKTFDEKKYHRLNRIQDRFFAAMVVEAKKRFPRRKILDVQKAYDLIGNDEWKKLQEPWMDEFRFVGKKYNEFKEGLRAKLKEISHTYEIEPTNEKVMLRSRNGGEYHTQGYGANKYAEASLEEDRLLLELLGYDVEIRRGSISDADRWGISYISYELWANVTEMDFEILRMRGEFISVLNWAVLCWRKNANPKVYFPFLSNEDYDKSQILSRMPNYVINRDTMKLELSYDEIKDLQNAQKPKTERL